MLTDAQLLTLKNAIAAETDPTFAALRTAGATGQMAEWLNGNSDFVVWRTLISEQELTRETSPEGTTWSWTAYKALTVQEQGAWSRMFNGTYTINPALPNVRAGLGEIFSGSANGFPAQRTHLLAMGKRFATRAEKVFAAGTGTSATPGTLTFEGAVSDYDVIRAVN